MTIRLENTTASAINDVIAHERHHIGTAATGMVLTLVIVTDEEHQAEAARAATYSANQHPCRILIVIARPARGKPRLDADIHVGDGEGPGEMIRLRLIGPLAHQQASVVVPLLLPDTPVVAWWPARAPADPSADPVGQLAARRITDAASSRNPLATLADRAHVYQPGDTDMAWTRTTAWRSLLATALDEPFPVITSAEVLARKANPSATLLASWISARLGVRTTVTATRAEGIAEVRLHTADGDIGVARPDGHLAKVYRPEFTSRGVPMPRRELRDLLSEELRRLDSDEIYAQALGYLGKHVEELGVDSSKATDRSAKPRKTTNKKPSSKKTKKRTSTN
ncbi:MAG: glucose-6-phosphate dehydrogenase assembly protein OpcA [Candidatus Nanopelagicales bacterium]